MIYDILDILTPKPRFTAMASYYEETFDDASVGRQTFNYEYVNPYSNTYRRLFANIQSCAGEVVIRTNDQLNFKINGKVITQDNRAFNILQVENDFQAANKQALRCLGVPPSVEYVLRLISIQNPWGLQ